MMLAWPCYLTPGRSVMYPVQRPALWALCWGDKLKEPPGTWRRSRDWTQPHSLSVLPPSVLPNGSPTPASTSSLLPLPNHLRFFPPLLPTSPFLRVCPQPKTFHQRVELSSHFAAQPGSCLESLQDWRPLCSIWSSGEISGGASGRLLGGGFRHS